MPDAETEIATHEGVEWARWPDGTILYWGDDAKDWLRWRDPKDSNGGA